MLLVLVLPLGRGAGYFSGHVELDLALHLDGGVGRFDGADHFLFRHFVHLPFHHHDAVHGTGDHHVDVGFLELLVGRVDDEFAADAGDADFRDGAVKRNVADRECGRGRESSEAVRHVHLVGGHELDHHLRFGVVVLREGGAQGAVHEAHHEHFRVARAGLPLEETAGEAARGGVLLAVIHGQGEEVDPF